MSRRGGRGAEGRGASDSSAQVVFNAQLTNKFVSHAGVCCVLEWVFGGSCVLCAWLCSVPKPGSSGCSVQELHQSA